MQRPKAGGKLRLPTRPQRSAKIPVSHPSKPDAIKAEAAHPTVIDGDENCVYVLSSIP
jgi:hypothetical protein